MNMGVHAGTPAVEVTLTKIETKIENLK